MLHQHCPVPRVHLAKLLAVFQAVEVLGARLYSALPACYIIRLAHTQDPYSRGGQNDDLLPSTFTSTFDPTGRQPSLPFKKR
jgi:hypothetical protein